MKRHPNKQYGLEASEYVAPAEMTRIAEERTLDILGIWGNKMRWGHAVTVKQLAESCYMQGVNDTVDAVTRTDALKRLMELDKPKPRNLPA